MKQLFALATSMVLMAGPLATPFAFAAEPPTPYASFNFTHKGQDGTFSVTCFGQLRLTRVVEEGVEPKQVCDGQSLLNVTWNGKTTTDSVDTRLPRNMQVMQDTSPEDQGILWYTPRVVNGSVKRLLVIQNNTWDNLYGGVGGAPSAQTIIFNFDTRQFSTIVNPSGRKLYWNKAGTRAFFVANNCGGAGCEATSPIMGITLTSKQAVTLSKIKAAFFQDFEPNRTQAYHEAGKETRIQTWKSGRWITDRLIEAKYMTADGKVKTLRLAF